MVEISYMLRFVLASNYRKNVMLALQVKPIISSAISNKTTMYRTHVSNTLSKLVEKNLVICLTPKLKKGRLYDLTNEGHRVLCEIIDYHDNINH